MAITIHQIMESPVDHPEFYLRGYRLRQVMFLSIKLVVSVWCMLDQLETKTLKVLISQLSIAYLLSSFTF